MKQSSRADFVTGHAQHLCSLDSFLVVLSAMAFVTHGLRLRGLRFSPAGAATAAELHVSLMVVLQAHASGMVQVDGEVEDDAFVNFIFGRFRGSQVMS